MIYNLKFAKQITCYRLHITPLTDKPGKQLTNLVSRSANWRIGELVNFLKE